MEHAAHLDAIAGVRIGPILGGYQDPPGPVAEFLDVGRIVVPIAQDKVGLSRQFGSKAGASSLSAALAAVSSAANGIQTAATVATKCNFQP